MIPVIFLRVLLFFCDLCNCFGFFDFCDFAVIFCDLEQCVQKEISDLALDGDHAEVLE